MESFDQALGDFSKAIQLKPDYAEAYNNRGGTYHSKGYFDQAIEDLSASIKYNPNPAGTYNNRGVVSCDKGNFDDAIADHNKAIKLNPKFAEAYFNRANAYTGKRDFDDAIADYSKAIELRADYYFAYINRGNAYDSKGEVDKAIAEYNDAIKLEPERSIAYNNRGFAYRKKGNRAMNQAIADFSKVIQLDPEFTMAYYNRAEVRLRLREWEKARTDLMTAKKMGVDIVAAFCYDYENVADFKQKTGIQLPSDIAAMLNPDPSEPAGADTYIASGIDYCRKSKYDLAIRNFRMAIQLNPEAVDAYYYRGLAYHKKSESDRAIDDFTKAITLKPDYVDAYYSRGITYHNKGIFDKAIEDFSEVISLRPDYADAYYNRGAAYYSIGKFDQAIEDYDKAIDFNSDFAEAYKNRGMAYHHKGEIERAITDYTEAIRLSPKNPDAYYSRAVAYSNKDEIERAVTDYTKTIQLKPDYVNAYNNRGVAYFKKGEVNAAIDDYTEAISLESDYAGVYYNRGEAWLYLQEWEKAKDDLITAKDKGVDIIAAFRNDYKDVATFERKNQVKLPEDIAALIRQGFRNRYPRKEKVLDSDGKPLESQEVLNLLERFQNTDVSLGEYVKSSPYFGIETVPTEVFVIDGKTRDELIAAHRSSADILKPFLQGRDIRRWQVDPQDRWLIFAHRGIQIDSYPAILSYLEEYKGSLSKRGGEHEWYELQASIDEAESFVQTKLVCPHLYNTHTFALEADGFYCGHTCLIIPTDETWLCGLLNTRAVEWFYSQVSKQLRVGELEARGSYIKQIPVPNINATEKDLVRKLVDYLIYLQGQPTTNSEDLTHARDFAVLKYFEWIINGLVYEFYMPDVLQNADRDIFKHLMAEQLPEIDEIQGDKMSVLRSLYERLHDRENPVRVNLFFQDSLRPIRIIEDKW